MATGELELMIQELETDLELRPEDSGKGPMEREFVFNSRTRFQEGNLFLFLEIAHATLARGEDEHAVRAREYLARARAIEELAEHTRFSCALYAGQLELKLGRIEAAYEELGLAHESVCPTLLPVELALLTVLESQLARFEGAEAQDLDWARESLAESVEDLCDDWRHGPRVEGGSGRLRYSRTRSVIEELLVLDDQLEGPERALERLVDVQASVLREPLDPIGDSWLLEVREALLPAGGGILVYFPGLATGHLFVIDADSVQRLELVGEDDLRAVIEGFNAVVSTVPARARASRSSDLDTAGRRIVDSVLPPIVLAKLESWSAVTIVATGRIGQLHFRALPFGEGRLGEEKAVGFLPSLALGLALARREAAPPVGEIEVLVIGAPPSSSGRPSLEVSAREWRRLLRAYPTERQRLFTGDEATTGVLASVDLSRLPVLQFIAHGVYDPDRPLPWGLALTDEELYSEHIRSLDSAPRGIVILSSCGSGTGPLRVGEEEQGHMGGELLWGGAQAVVLSQADTALGATLALSSALHDGIGSGQTPAEALRRASAALVFGGEYADPFHHCLVRVLGLAHRPVFEPRPLPEPPAEYPWLIITLLGGVVVGLVTVLLLRARRGR